MRFVYGKIDWLDENRGQENCYLLTNGLGGFSSQSMTGSNARNDQALLMACLCAPTDRYHMVTRLEEEVEWQDQDGEGSKWQQDTRISLSAQQYVDYTKNKGGHRFLQSFVMDDFPVWIYQTGGLQIRKTMVMKQGENTVGVQYRMNNRGRNAARLILTPLLQFVPKGQVMPPEKPFALSIREKGEETCGTITSKELCLHFWTNGKAESFDTAYEEDLYYAHDSRDGRPAIGRAAKNHRIFAEIPAGEERCCEVVYSVEHDFRADGERACEKAGDAGSEWEGRVQKGGSRVDAMLATERMRLKALTEQAGLEDETAGQLVKAADQFVVRRQSTGGKSIIAGYPFFGDWGRDTMIAMVGCCISTGRYEDAKSIFRTFRKYCKNGIMPNMFPEGKNPPMYNTADASLLFISAVYEYYLRSGDLAFVKECWETMKDIVEWYKKGTDFHIGMDEDGLIYAGAGLDQVTWMDVRYQDILPTPRHGKAVEINAYWYNDLCIMDYFARQFFKEDEADGYRQLAGLVKESFCMKFWNEEEGCLKDVLAAEETELPASEQKRRRDAQYQVRCNQIWAVSQRFSMLPPGKEKAVVDKVFENLYTPRGLRSLSPKDAAFCGQYMGCWKHRDLSYHQGTVWGFLLGGYFLSYLKVNGYSGKAKEDVKEQLSGVEGALREGCIGQLAEVYDGENPVVSEGCFAQAWSTAELLRVYEALER